MSADKFDDRGYRRLFSHPRMVEDLIRSFVKEDFVDDIDFSKLTPLKTSYVTDEFSHRESDVIWKAEIKGKTAYFYILIEFQSSVDRFMALRLLLYLLLFYQDLIGREELDRLPSVFPILLYNGDRKWNAPDCIQDLIEMPFSGFVRYIPHFSYFKIAENEFSEESLKALKSITAGIFLIETAPIARINDVIDVFLEIYGRETDPELKRTLGLWIREKLRARHLDLERIDFDKVEVRPMLETRLKEYEERIRQEAMAEGEAKGLTEGEARGKAEGEARGKAEGEARGKAEALRQSLELFIESRFGAIEDTLAERIESIEDPARLEQLLKAALKASDIADIIRIVE
jgi:predicted transposase YdaD